MSNQLVGSVYSSIIEEVINSSRIDFEEAGINVSTLEDLKHVWRGKLSGLKIAQFPWDPPVPDTAPAATNGTPAQARAQQHHLQQLQQQQQQQQQLQQQQLQQSQPHIKQEPYAQAQNGVKIKSEPGLEQQGVYAASLTGTPTHDPQLAAFRAQQNIAQKFGPQLHQARPQSSGLVLPGMNPGPPPHQNQRLQHQNGIPQHDGGDDYDEEQISIEGFGSLTREEADNVLLTRIGRAKRQRAKATEELSQALEGLKVSSAKRKAKGKGRARRSRNRDAYEEALDFNSSYPYPSSITSEAGPSGLSGTQLDAAGDSDDNDEDAINSDLDDPEDDEIDNDDDDEVPQIMLCMYDKVQRTKNKWKCVLKDGVLTINGREYVFHKANGEYEW